MNLKQQFRAFYADTPPLGAKQFAKGLAHDAAWQALHPVRAVFYTHAWLTAALTGTAVCAVAGGGVGAFMMLQSAPPPPEQPPIFETQPVTTEVTETTCTTWETTQSTPPDETTFSGEAPITTEVTETTSTTAATTTTAVSTTSAAVVETTSLTEASAASTSTPAVTQPVSTTCTTVAVTSAETDAPTETAAVPTTEATAETNVIYTPPEMNGTKWLLYEDLTALASLGDALTWNDLAPYLGEDIGSGLYVYRFPIMDANSYLYLLAGGDLLTDPHPYYVYLTDEDGTLKEDIRSEEFRAAMELDWWSDPEDDDAHRQAARTIGKWALEQLQNGTFTLDTQLTADDLDAETAALFRENDFTFLTFANAHTVHLMLNKGLLDAYGYLVTDGTVQYALHESVPVTGKRIGYDGGCVTIDAIDGDVYYFFAGT